MSILSRFYFKPVSYVGICAITKRETNRSVQRVLDEQRCQQPHQSDENTRSSLMSTMPMLDGTNGFRSLHTFDVGNFSCGHLLF